MQPEIAAFIFDLDGVITDTAELHFQSWSRLAQEENLPFTRQDNEALRGISRRESLNLILKGRPIEESVAQAWMKRKNDYYQTLLEDISPADRLPGVTQLLEQAHAAGIKTAVASASRNAKVVLERLQLLDQFDVIGDGYCVVNTKPAPDLFLWVAGRLNVNPKLGVVFEDAEAGIDAALAGGFWTIGVGKSAITHAHVVVPDMSNVTVPFVLQAISDVAAHTTPGG